MLGTVVPLATPVIDIENTVHLRKDFDFDKLIHRDLPQKDRTAVRAFFSNVIANVLHYPFILWDSLISSTLNSYHTHPPVHQTPYPSAYEQRHLIQCQVGEMFNDSVIQPSTIFLIRKV